MSDPHPSPEDEAIYEITTRAPGPAGALPLTDELLTKSPSGDIFGLTQNVGMGWEPSLVTGRQFLILSTQGGLRAPGWQTHRARLSHRTLGDRAARGGGGARIARPRHSAVCGGVL